MQKWTSFKKELLKNSEFKSEYERLKPKYDLITQLINARLKAGLSQTDLAKKVGTKQSAIARLESGQANPTVSYLEKVAKAVNSNLYIYIK